MDIETLRHAQGLAAGILANTSAEQLSQSTPCESWNVGQLVDHMVGSQHWGRCGIAGIEMTDTGEAASTGDFANAYNQAAADCVEAFSEEGAMARTVNPGFGDMPAPALLGLLITDTFTHAWDLARATGQPSELDPELAAELLAISKQSIQDSFRGPEGAPFGLEQNAPEGAPAADQLAAFLGRTV